MTRKILKLNSKGEKLYPFSLQKHAHDIEFKKNRTFNVRADMESGAIPWNDAEYDRLDKDYQELSDLLCVVLSGSRDGLTSWLTGSQLGKAKEVVAWAGMARAATQEAKRLTTR